MQSINRSWQGSTAWFRPGVACRDRRALAGMTGASFSRGFDADPCRAPPPAAALPSWRTASCEDLSKRLIACSARRMRGAYAALSGCRTVTVQRRAGVYADKASDPRHPRPCRVGGQRTWRPGASDTRLAAPGFVRPIPVAGTLPPPVTINPLYRARATDGQSLLPAGVRELYGHRIFVSLPGPVEQSWVGRRDG